MPATLHTLNAARVIAEYCIVSYHIFFGHPDSSQEQWDSSKLISSLGVSCDLMSFFFVLSGFVSVYSMSHDDKVQYITRKLKKIYPMYIFALLLGIPRYILDLLSSGSVCLWHEVVSLCSQVLFLQSWMGYGFVGSNSPSWYLSSLFWMWLIFPHLQVDKWIQWRPWLWICIFYIISLGASAIFIPFGNSISRQLPVIRIWDFLIGCATAYTLTNPIPGRYVFVAWVLYCGYACCSTVFSDMWDEPPSNVKYNQTQGCGFWKIQNGYALIPGRFVTVTSIMWALCIHWLSCSELESRENVVIRILSYDFFKSLSRYSLQLYLLHFPMDSAIQGFCKSLGIHMWLSKDLIIIWCYSSSYFIYCTIQPILDRWARLGSP